MSNHAGIVVLGSWLQTPPGHYALAWEQRQLDALVADIFGYNALQAGLAELDGLRQNRMPLKFYAAPALPACEIKDRWQAVTLTRFEELPFCNQSLDLIVLAHALEFAEEPHQVLREVERVLIPEGQVIITGFNPYSLWGMRQAFSRGGLRPAFLPDQGQFISLTRLKDWLKLLNLEVHRGRFGCYAPACGTEKWLNRWAFMEKAGDRWWPVCGAVYCVSAIKRVRGLRLIGPAWKERKARAKALAIAPMPAPQHTHRHEPR
jgi:SAM-dependent methyltransferase